MMFCLSYKTIRGLTKKVSLFYFNYYEQIKDRYPEIGSVVR